jgi:hypothetical protein
MAVLSLLAITAGLVAGFAVLANLDNRKISNALHSPYATAKKNALRAVGDALAKLQAATGQDTAATAKADIFEITPAEHKHWVGAWRVQKSNEQSPTEQDTKIFLTWLISGNHYGENDSQNTPAENKRIAIIDPSRKHVPPVTAELVDAPGNSENPGQFAYWIDDQSLKIQCNLHNPGNLSRDLFSKQIKTIPDHWFIKRQCQGRYGTEMAENSADNPLTQNFLQNNPAIAGNPDYGWLLDYPNFSEQQRQYLQQKYHDFNAFSLGLLTDTRRGGFRKNLCDDHSGTYRPEIPNDAFIFAPPTSFPAPPTTWGYYKSFYNLGAEIASGNIAPRPVNPLYRPQSGVNYGDCSLTCSTDAAGYSTGSISGTHAADLGIPTQYGIYPICTAFKNYMILYYFDGYAPDNATSSGYGRYQSLRMQPGFYFENPYAYNLSSAPITIWQGAPFVSGPENNATERYQKQPTFRCKLSYADGTSDDGLYQNYPNSANDDTKVFPFLATDPDRYLRPIWDGMITTNFPRATAKYIHLNSHTSYIASGKSKKFTTHNSKDLRNYEVNDIRFYQSAAHASEVAASCQIHSYPSADQPGNFAPWPNDTDQWSPFYLRTMDGNGDIFQQICDVNLQYAAVDGPMADRNMQTSSLVRGKEIPLYLCCARLKQGPVSSADCRIVHPNMADMGCDLRPFANANPRAPLSCRTARQDDIASFIYAGSFFPGNGSWEAHWLGLSDANNNVYSSRLEHALFADYPKFRNLFDLPHPTHKILNLGFLQHMDVGCFSYHPSYAIGNSYQNPWIARDRFFQENAAIAGSTWPSHHRVEMLYDYSYCLNRALWDSYFYASYDPIAKILLNPNYKAFIGATESQLNSFDAAAAMAIRGAFNVNSTSVEAWATFFGGAIDSIGTSGGAEFSRIQTIESAANIGLRSLNKDQIRALAARVVEQIKKRGIAGSLGEFVNRKLVSKASDSGRLGTKGALQAAIDGTNINDGYGGDSVNSARGKAWFDDDAASGPFWAGAPEYLTQADILQSVATTLCARGDTFCIHAYGNALAKNGSKIAEARCEVLVQRTADLLDSDRPELGRKYRILAIKWAIPGKFL